jgi:DnaJ-class molecular chaperone
MSEYHKILKLKNGASQEEIQAAYDKLKIELDPTNNDNQEEMAVVVVQ